MYIDSHAHLFDKAFAGDLAETIARARDAGVELIIVPGTDEKTSREAVELAEKYDCIRACVGIHPHDARHANDKSLAEIEALSSHRKVVAIGEIGMDFHYDFSPRDVQGKVFRDQITLAARRSLPIVVHTRESLEETMNIVESVASEESEWKPGSRITGGRDSALRGVFHCFTGSAADVARLSHHGFTVSYPGIVTFKNSSVLSVLKEIGYKDILLETDSPYMAPVPHRGKRNEPAHIVEIGRLIAATLRVPEAEVARVTSDNARALFGIAKDAGA